jgi:hypothetical protein
MLKTITHVGVFIAGTLVGVGWGYYHQNAAADVAAIEHRQMLNVKAEVSKAKIALINKFVGDHPDAQYQDMLQKEQKDLDDTNKQMQSEQTASAQQ